MLTDCMKYAAQIDQFRTIQLQRFDGRPASARPTNNAREIVTPGKMSGPLLSAGMEQGHSLSGFWVSGVRFYVLMAVATQTRESQIVQFCMPPCSSGDDMLHCERLGGEVSLAPTVFATTLSACKHCPPLGRCHTSFRH
jgi:hypothetical protein